MDCQRSETLREQWQIGTAPHLLPCGKCQALQSSQSLARDNTAANGTAPVSLFLGICWRVEVKVNGGAVRFDFPIDVMKKARTGVGAIESGLVNAQKLQL